ncbi:MAG: hypothetical protein ACRC3B_02540 [Bacteroidia bacterium]
MKPLHGGSIALLKSFNNRCFIGGSAGLYYDRVVIRTVFNNYTESERILIPLLIENKLRLAIMPQQRRASAFLSLNFGYTINASYKAFGLNSEYTQYGMGAVTLQSLAGLRINFDEHSGYIIELGAMYMPLRNRLESSSQPVLYHGYTEALEIVSVLARVSYFF